MTHDAATTWSGPRATLSLVHEQRGRIWPSHR